MGRNLQITAQITDLGTGRRGGVSGLSVTTTGDNRDSGDLDVLTSEVSYTLSTDIGNAGYGLFINRDTTNYIDLGFATGVYPCRLLPTQAAILPLAPATASFFAIANTATCRMEFEVFEA
jgi:hypothetical protein